MDLLTPSYGIIIWTSVIFLLLVFILGKWAWKPILGAINKRETDIVDAMNQAKLAREEMQNLKADNERILRQAKIERENILKEAREIRDKMVNDAKDIAKSEAEKMIDQARQSIVSEKAAALSDIKQQIGTLSVNIAESILRQKLGSENAQNELVKSILDKTNLN